MSRASRGRLNERALHLFPGETLFAKIAQTLCHAACVPRKEFFESWEVAKRAHRRFEGGSVVELCAGHGLVAQMMLLLDPSLTHALCVDRRKPQSAARVQEAFAERWPRMKGRVHYEEQELEHAPASESSSIVVGVHSCGTLSDRVLEHAMAAKARLVLLPCCHAFKKSDRGGMDAWMEGSLGIDVMRVQRLRADGYEVRATVIPADITPMNRLLLASPPPAPAIV